MAQTQTLATFPSKSKPGLVHSVRLGKDNVVYCTCPNWKYQHRPCWDRQCLHTRKVVADLAKQQAQAFAYNFKKAA